MGGYFEKILGLVNRQVKKCDNIVANNLVMGTSITMTGTERL